MVVERVFPPLAPPYLDYSSFSSSFFSATAVILFLSLFSSPALAAPLFLRFRAANKCLQLFFSFFLLTFIFTIW